MHHRRTYEPVPINHQFPFVGYPGIKVSHWGLNKDQTQTYYYFKSPKTNFTIEGLGREISVSPPPMLTSYVGFLRRPMPTSAQPQNLEEARAYLRQTQQSPQTLNYHIKTTLIEPCSIATQTTWTTLYLWDRIESCRFTIDNINVTSSLL